MIFVVKCMLINNTLLAYNKQELFLIFDFIKIIAEFLFSFFQYFLLNQKKKKKKIMLVYYM